MAGSHLVPMLRRQVPGLIEVSGKAAGLLECQQLACVQASGLLVGGPVAGCLDKPVAGNPGQWLPVVHHPVHWPVVASGFAVHPPVKRRST